MQIKVILPLGLVKNRHRRIQYMTISVELPVVPRADEFIDFGDGGLENERSVEEVFHHVKPRPALGPRVCVSIEAYFTPDEWDQYEEGVSEQKEREAIVKLLSCGWLPLTNPPYEFVT